MSKILFDTQQITDLLPTLDLEQINGLDFGLIGFDTEGIVRQYNTFEAEVAGLSVENVVGEDLFTAVAPCMNNFLVAQKFDDAVENQESMDTTIDYVLTLRMKPTKVKLRLIASPALPLNYVLLQRNL